MFISAAILGAVLLAQPEPRAIERALLFSSAYSDTTTAERTSIVLTDGAGAQTEFETIFREAMHEGGIITSFELPGLLLHHHQGVLTAERLGEPNPAVVFRVEREGVDFLAAIAPHVPPMPMPQLWRFDEAGRCTDPAFGAIEVERYDTASATLFLMSQAGSIQLVIDPVSARARALDAPLSDGRFQAEYEPIEPGDPRAWSIPTEGRWVVTRLAQLSPPRSPLTPGLKLDDLILSTPSYQGWRLSEIQGDERVRQSGPWVVLLFCRADAEADVFDLAGEVASKLWQSAAQEIADLGRENADRYWLGHRSIVVSVSGELEVLPEQMRAMAERSPRGVALLVSTEPAKTIDRLVIPAPLTAVLVDPSRTVGAVVPIENAETGVSAVMEAMRSFVRRDEPAVTSETGG